MQNWLDANPYLALLPYLDERAWLLPKILDRRTRRDRPTARRPPADVPDAAEIRDFLATSGHELSAQILRRLRPEKPPPALWHVAVWRQPPTQLRGAFVAGAPAGTGKSLRAQALQSLALGEVILSAAPPGRRGRPAIFWLHAGRRASSLALAASPRRGSPSRVPPADFAPPNGTRWTGTYFDQFRAPPPRAILEVAANLACAVAGARGATPPRGCIVLTHESGREPRGTYCPGLPPETGSRLTRQIREMIASYDRSTSLPALCVDRKAQCSAMALIEWDQAGPRRPEDR